MALRFGSFSRIILNGTHTVALAALASDPRITLGLKLGDGALSAIDQGGEQTALSPFPPPRNGPVTSYKIL
jgi:hypothetical protein